MKATGIVRRLDDLGRICLPKELRRSMELNEGDPLEVYTENDGIVLKKYTDNQQCCKCGEVHDKMIFDCGKGICPDCLAAFNAWV